MQDQPTLEQTQPETSDQERLRAAGGDQSPKREKQPWTTPTLRTVDLTQQTDVGGFTGDDATAGSGPPGS